MLKPLLILLCILSYIGHGHLTWGSEMFDIYVVVEEETKEDVFQELSEKYDVVEEQSFFLPNKALLVARSRRKTTGSRSKNFLLTEEEITEDVLIFRQKPNVFLTNKIELLERHVRTFSTNDTQWSNMWQINGGVSSNMKVVEAWQNGYNGSGIVVSVVDQGLETDHSDLDANVRVDGHYDFVDNDIDPNPPFNYNHGTRVAGFIAAKRDNDNCIVGVAYSSTLIGIRLLGSNYTTDISEAQAISHGYNVTDISSNSWGPPDSYGYFAPGALTAAAFQLGVTRGRGGKGVIYVWAAGNGGTTDNCNADGYANSIYTVTISSVNSIGQPAWYSEVCAPALAVTYSGDKNQRYMVTTSNGDVCDGGIEGTSFSTPQAAGMVALALQANPNLSWRDVQHLIVKTAKYQNLTEATEYGFTQNGAGNYVGQMFGYGLMDAEAMVRYAKIWRTVPQQEICNDTISTPYWVFNSSLTTTSESLLVSACNIRYLEHVQVHTIFQSSERAYVELKLVSPMGTHSKLMTQRRYDRGVSREQEWTFMSVQFWGEDAAGNWTFSMTIPKNQTGNLTSWQLILYGTSSDPLPGISACNDSACQNGGTCTSSSKYDSYNCTCVPGYDGQLCKTDINECDSNPCPGGATCVNLINDYNCTCSAGYFYNHTANKCQDINECESNPCLGNSTCKDQVNGYNCTCPSGYTYNETTGDCRDINECDSNPCPGGATCVNLINDYNCKCSAGYFYNRTANKCQDINECESNPCLGNSNCKDQVNGYNCTCPSGYTYNKTTGDCQDNDECKLQYHRCCKEEDCINTIGSYTCNCTRQKQSRNASPVDELSPEEKWVIGVVCVFSGTSLVVLVVGARKQSLKIPHRRNNVKIPHSRNKVSAIFGTKNTNNRKVSNDNACHGEKYTETISSENTTGAHKYIHKLKVSPYSKGETGHTSLEDNWTTPVHTDDHESLRTSVFYLNSKQTFL